MYNLLLKGFKSLSTKKPKVVKNNPSLEGFVEFVNSKPKNERINHSTWATCAVGEYLGQYVTRNLKDKSNKFVKKELISINRFSELGANTYGELQIYLRGEK